MRVAVIFSTLLVVASTSGAEAQRRSSYGYSGTGSNPRSTYTAPYTTRDGTRVQGYNRTMPNSTQRDNYQTRGNYNPWTGQTGTRPAWR